MKRFLIGGALALACALASLTISTSISMPAVAAGLDDELSSQQAREVPRELLQPQMLFDAGSTSVEAAPATSPADAPNVITSTEEASPSATSDFSAWLVGFIALVISGLVGWVLRRAGVSGDSLASVQHLVDNGIDLVRAVAASELAKLADKALHDTTVGKTFDVVWPLAKKFMAQLGWDEARLKTYIASRVAPETA